MLKLTGTCETVKIICLDYYCSKVTQVCTLFLFVHQLNLESFRMEKMKYKAKCNKMYGGPEPNAKAATQMQKSQHEYKSYSTNVLGHSDDS